MAAAIRSLRASEVDGMSVLMGHAFFADPGAVFTEPDPARRVEVNAAVFAVVLRFGLAVGEVLTTDDLAGIAVWLPPDHSTASEADLERAGQSEANAIAGPEATARLAVMFEQFEALHREAIDEPHWRLELLGVDPARQGKGIAKALIAPIHARADEAGLRCELETFTPFDVAFYERRGYRVAASGDIPGTSVTIRAMVRQPRSRFAIVQTSLPEARSGAPLVAALHPANAMLLLGVGIVVAWRATGFARADARDAASSASQE